MDISEHDRLRVLYGQMADGELTSLARELKSLTDVAREVITAEFKRRGLDLPEQKQDPRDLPPDKLVVVGRFRDLPELAMARGILASADIECFPIDENTVRMNLFYSNAIGGIKLAVREQDAQFATELLNQPPLERFEIEGVGDFEQPRCPACQSADIAFEGLNKPVAYTTAYLGVPIPLSSNVWSCNSCGQHWENTDD